MQNVKLSLFKTLEIKVGVIKNYIKKYFALIRRN